MNEQCNSLGQPTGIPLSEWVECPKPPRLSMGGRYCRLEALDPDMHAKPLWGAFSDHPNEKSWTYLPYGPFRTFDEFCTWLEDCCTRDDPLFYAILDIGTWAPLGLVSYLRIQAAIGSIEVGHLHYSPALQRTAMATEAMFLMMSRVFDELGYRRYEWKCDALNQPSRAAAERLGFSFEGIFRQATIYKGRNRDTAWYSIIDQEWPHLKQAYEKWLSPENFDAQGRQRVRLATLIGESGICMCSHDE